MILWIMNAVSVSQHMKAPNQAPSTDVSFVSLTKSLVNTSEAKPHCPECNAEIDFSQDIEWLGPTAFICKSCEKAIDLHLVVEF
jgi:hypothetical protein